MVNEILRKIYIRDISNCFNISEMLFKNIEVKNLGNNYETLENTYWIESGVYKYMRKDGQPDRRYIRNKMLPDMAYLVISTNHARYLLYSTNLIQITTLVDHIDKNWVAITKL